MSDPHEGNFNGGINLTGVARELANPRWIVDTPDFVRAQATQLTPEEAAIDVQAVYELGWNMPQPLTGTMGRTLEKLQRMAGDQ
jgi:transposase InsO family protein